jgi:hypothetical protein
MFAVIAECFDSEEIYGWGLTPQDAWDSMLAEFNRAEHDIDMDTVRFFVETEVFRESKITWRVESDTDDE